MRVAFLMAGAGGMYCGSCLRDNRVAATLRAQGRDIVVIPLYTPIRTDETDVSEPHVYYGGINVYLQQKAGFFAHLPGWVRRALDAPVLLKQAMKFAGQTSPETLGELTISVLKGEDGAQRAELMQLVEHLRAIRPALVNLPDLFFVGVAREIKAALGVPVLCTLSGEDILLDGLTVEHREEAERIIRLRSGDVDGFVAVTEYFAGYAAERFGLARERVHVVPMGIDADESDGAPGARPRPAIGYFARICPEKGLHNLCEAFVRLRRQGRDCVLRAGGYLGNRQYLDGVRGFLREHAAEDRFEHVGELDRTGKFAFLRSLDVFSVPTVYHEAKGLYILEAMSCGVPVVQPRHGSFPELVDATGGGILYDPTGPEALAGALARLLDDAALRRRLGEAGRAAVRDRFTDRLMAERTWELYRQYVERPARGKA